MLKVAWKNNNLENIHKFQYFKLNSQWKYLVIKNKLISDILGADS